MSIPIPNAAKPDSALSDRRESTRFVKEPDSDHAVIWQQVGEEQLVEVHDESLGGICVIMADVTNLSVGSEMNVLYHRDLLRGQVRHINQRPDGMYLVGFQCHP